MERLSTAAGQTSPLQHVMLSLSYTPLSDAHFFFGYAQGRDYSFELIRATVAQLSYETAGYWTLVVVPEDFGSSESVLHALA